MVDLAVRQLGYVSPADTNPYNKWYWGGNGNGWAWCDAFVSWLGYQTSQTEVVGKSAACPTHVNWFKQRGQFVGGSAIPEVGDLIFFDWAGTPVGEADHVGLVSGIGADGTIWTIEGNTSDSSGYGINGKVAQHSYPRGWSQILGYGKPVYAKNPPVQAAKNIIQWTPNFQQNQRFVFGEPDDGYVTIKDAAKGRCIDIFGSNTDPGTPVIAWEPNGQKNQRWKPETCANGLTRFRSCLDPLLMLDITASSLSAGARACAYPETGNLNQQFVLVPAGDAYYIIAAHSLLPLDVYGG
jgi:hypothetical protein